MLHWLQPDEGKSPLEALQLDIVGFLAILGEGSVLANAQVLTLSKWIFMPRLVPAPQALMRPTRPEKLEPAPGVVTGIFSGNLTNTINHIGNIVCDANNLPAYSVRVVEIKRVDENRPLKAKSFAPLTFVLFLGVAFSCMLLGLSIHFNDGMSIVATILLSLLSSLIGWGNKWTLRLPKRTITNTNVPLGDVVIKYPKGSFLVVRCQEGVARELYFAPESIDYLLTHGPAYRIMSLVGTVMLMGGVICLANAQIELQIAWAGSYMLLGSMYWIVAALPAKLHWDTSAYKVVNQCMADSDMSIKGYPSMNETFTQALWKAIVLSRNIDWVKKSNACPETEAWAQWLNEARDKAREVGELPKDNWSVRDVVTYAIPDWNPQEALGNLLREQDDRNVKTMKEKIEEV